MRLQLVLRLLLRWLVLLLGLSLLLLLPLLLLLLLRLRLRLLLLLLLLQRAAPIIVPPVSATSAPATFPAILSPPDSLARAAKKQSMPRPV